MGIVDTSDGANRGFGSSSEPGFVQVSGAGKRSQLQSYSPLEHRQHYPKKKSKWFGTTQVGKGERKKELRGEEPIARSDLSLGRGFAGWDWVVPWAMMGYGDRCDTPLASFCPCRAVLGYNKYSTQVPRAWVCGDSELLPDSSLCPLSLGHSADQARKRLLGSGGELSRIPPRKGEEQRSGSLRGQGDDWSSFRPRYTVR